MREDKDGLNFPNKSSFIVGKVSDDKGSDGGKVENGKDLRTKPGMNQGKMPSTVG